LGEIYRTRQGNLTAAAEAFEAACRLDPENQIRHEILAELYAADPNQWQKAVEHHNKLLDMKYDRVESFQSLYRIYMQSQQYDKAFCVAAALRFMNRASPEEQGFHEQYRQKGLVVAKRIIDDEVWRTQIADKNENNYISAIFRLISRYVAGIYAQEEKDKGLKRKDRVDFAGTKLNFTQRFQQINQIMKVAVPLLYIQPSRPGFDYECLNIEKQFMPAVVAGGDLLSNKGDKEIVFLIAKNLAYLRPEYFLIRALKMNQATIKVILRSAMVMVAPKLAVPPAEQGAVLQFVQKFQTIIPQPIIGQVKTVVERAISEGNDFSTTSWMQNVEIAANRAGLLLCNDLEVAARTVQADPTPLSTLTVKDKLKDLIRYGISEDYFQLRESLGLTIG
jgi:golgin subfamily B member 1